MTEVAVRFMQRSEAAVHVLWLSLRAKRGNPCGHEVMDRHGLRPRDDAIRRHGLLHFVRNDGDGIRKDGDGRSQ